MLYKYMNFHNSAADDDNVAYCLFNLMSTGL